MKVIRSYHKKKILNQFFPKSQKISELTNFDMDGVVGPYDSKEEEMQL